MRLLKINSIVIDIDEQTAIGIDFQSYSVKEPGLRFVNVSNTFTIPKTNKNLGIFGNAQNPQSLSTSIYDKYTCDYWNDNEQLIKNSKCRIEEISDRIYIFVYQKLDIWEELKTLYWEDFLTQFISYLQTVKGLPSQSSPYTGPSLNFFAGVVVATDNIILPMYYGNLYDYDPLGGSNYLEDQNNIYMHWDLDAFFNQASGGHFCIFAKTIFEFLQWKYNVNFLVNETGVEGNIWEDPIATQIYIPAREIGIRYSGTPAACSIYYQTLGTYANFLPLIDQRDKLDKTLHDFVNAFFQHFNILKDEFEIDGEPVIRLARFDDLENASVINWSGKFGGVQKFYPKVEGYSQNNLIKFKEIFPEGNSLINSKNIISENKNLDVNNDLLEIDAYIPSFLPVNTHEAPDLSIKETFKTFIFLINNEFTTSAININIKDINDPGPVILANLNMFTAGVYNLDGEYNFLDSIITYPRVFEIKKWLTTGDIKNFEFFKQYWFQELNASFFINKIVGFNPQKSLEPTTLEVIKISDKTPYEPEEYSYWVDGIADIWTDGVNDYFY